MYVCVECAHAHIPIAAWGYVCAESSLFYRALLQKRPMIFHGDMLWGYAGMGICALLLVWVCRGTYMYTHTYLGNLGVPRHTYMYTHTYLSHLGVPRHTYMYTHTYLSNLGCRHMYTYTYKYIYRDVCKSCACMLKYVFSNSACTGFAYIAIYIFICICIHMTTTQVAEVHTSAYMYIYI